MGSSLDKKKGEKKNGLEDLKKARKNLDFAIETLESGEK